MKSHFLKWMGCLSLCSASLMAENLIRPGEHVAIVGNTLADQFRTYGYLETLLMEQTKANPISMRNLGWAGDTLTKRDRPTNFPSHTETLKQFGADLIILGTHGRGVMYQVLVGSTSEGVLKKSKRPLLLVPAP